MGEDEGKMRVREEREGKDSGIHYLSWRITGVRTYVSNYVQIGNYLSSYSNDSSGKLNPWVTWNVYYGRAVVVFEMFSGVRCIRRWGGWSAGPRTLPDHLPYLRVTPSWDELWGLCWDSGQQLPPGWEWQLHTLHLHLWPQQWGNTQFPNNASASTFSFKKLVENPVFKYLLVITY